MVLAGGNQQKNADFVLSHAAQLQAVFLDHSMDRANFLSRVRVWAQVEPAELSMDGALGVARTLAPRS